MAGAAGFEPANGGTKSRCLTTWRRPKSVVDSIQGGNPAQADWDEIRNLHALTVK